MTSCVVKECGNLPLSVTHPDIVDLYGKKAKLGNCAVHELELLRNRIALAESYLTQIEGGPDA